MKRSEIYRIVGANIRWNRKLAGISQDYLARRLGLGRTSIANIEAGNQGVAVHHLWIIAEVLECDWWDLLPERDQVGDGYLE